MNIMGFSIQDNLKKINSSLTFIDILSLLITFTILSLFAVILNRHAIKNILPVVYTEGKNLYAETRMRNLALAENDPRPFGSKKGKTYTYTWCNGSGNIKQANKVYFKTTQEAEGSGRALSKLCKR